MMCKCSVCEGRDIFQAQDIEDLYWMLTDVSENLGEIAIITEYDVAKELLFQAMSEEVKLGMVEIDQYDYDGAYIVTFSLDDEEYTISIKFASVDGDYLYTDCLTFIDYNWNDKCKYISDMLSRDKDFEYEMFVLGEIANTKEYSYANELHEGNVTASILVQSNIAEIVNEISELFEDYFE